MRLLWDEVDEDEEDRTGRLLNAPFQSAEPDVLPRRPDIEAAMTAEQQTLEDQLYGSMKASKGKGRKLAEKGVGGAFDALSVVEPFTALGARVLAEGAARDRRAQPAEPEFVKAAREGFAKRHWEYQHPGETMPEKVKPIPELRRADSRFEEDIDAILEARPQDAMMVGMESAGRRAGVPGSLIFPMALAASIGTPDPGDILDVRKAFKLAKPLAGAKPRYGYGQKLFELQFEDDIDRALYILAQPKPSKADAAYLEAVKAHTGLEEAELRAMGREVRQRIKDLAKVTDEGTIVVPRGGVKAKLAEPPRIPEAVEEPLPWDISEPEVPRETPTAPPGERIPGGVDEPPTTAEPPRPPRFPGDPDVSVNWFDRHVRPATEAIRRHGGLPGVPRAIAEKVSHMFEDVVYDRARHYNAYEKETREAWKKFEAMDEEGAKQVALSLEMELPHADATVQKEIVEPLRKWREAAFKSLEKEGVTIPGIRPTPHVNPEMYDIARNTSTSPDKAREQLRALYQKHRPGQWDETQIEDAFDALSEFDQKVTNEYGRRVAFLPNVKLSRSINIPGWLGDPLSPEFSKRAFKEGWDAYASQWSFGLADATHFGPETDKLLGKVVLDPAAIDPRTGKQLNRPIIDEATGWPKRTKGILSETENQQFRNLVLQHREHFVGGTVDSGDEWLSTIRQLETANKLGSASIPNAFQTFVTTAPATASVVGLRESLGTLREALKLVSSDPDFAKDIGALSEQLMLENASLAQALRGGVQGLASAGAEATLKVTGFQKLEEFNRAFAAAAGRVHLQKLGGLVRGGGPRSAAAADEIRKILGGREAAEELIQAARSGEDLLLRTPATDRFAYEFAHRTQFSANPNDLPILASTPIGRTLFQFKNFAYNFSRFVKTDIIDEARKGNRAPAYAFATMLTGAGLATSNLREALTPDLEDASLNPVTWFDQERDWKTNPLEWWGAAGGFGLATDLARDIYEGTKGTRYGTARAVGAAFGPTVSDAINILAEQAQQEGGFVGEVAERVVPNPFRLPRKAVEKLEEEQPIPPIGFGDPEGGSFNLIGGTEREKRRSPMFLDWTDIEMPDFTSEEPLPSSGTGGGMTLEW